MSRLRKATSLRAQFSEEFCRAGAGVHAPGILGRGRARRSCDNRRQRRLTAIVPGFEIGAAVGQQLHHAVQTQGGRRVERRVAVFIGRTYVGAQLQARV